MNTNIVGPFNAGYNAVTSLRGVIVDFNTPAGDIELGEIQASPKEPVFVEMFITDEVAFDGDMIVEFRIIATGPEIEMAGTQQVLTWAADVNAPYDGYNPPNKYFVVHANYRVFVHVWNGGTNTLGRTTLLIRVSGLGRRP